MEVITRHTQLATTLSITWDTAVVVAATKSDPNSAVPPTLSESSRVAIRKYERADGFDAIGPLEDKHSERA
ncbi:hypothetical protein EGR_04694 [Echinococcus granulosus]|uniref:Uncharacterized protein n=1 Tax=Echinococcus granulosus TaxID=6210 RepID=W6UG77_ECHGR|nr:hypothetical protein EGR_04694 [Echinococcus granulosus]EUB60500.1 hypothetical protein EGR_04694 [Echinococcus granulosus]